MQISISVRDSCVIYAMVEYLSFVITKLLINSLNAWQILQISTFFCQLFICLHLVWVDGEKMELQVIRND